MTYMCIPHFTALFVKTPSSVAARKKAMGYDLMSPFPLELVEKQMAFAGVDKLVLLGEDCAAEGGAVLSNEEIAKIVALDPGALYRLCHSRPQSSRRAGILRYAFGTLKLRGLKLHPAKQQFYPNDPKLFPIYELCLSYNVPVTFHCGMSWQPNTFLKYSHPELFEEVAVRYPQLRINLAHFGFPWVLETAAIILKYPNVYADTACCYMDCPEQFFEQLFFKLMGPLWVEHNLADKILFGSNNPRFRPARIKRGLEYQPFSKETMAKILGENAVRFLGLEVNGNG